MDKHKLTSILDGFISIDVTDRSAVYDYLYQLNYDCAGNELLEVLAYTNDGGIRQLLLDETVIFFADKMKGN